MGLEMDFHAPEITYQRARDGYPLASRVWRNDRAHLRVLVLHGIVSHSGWYHRSCRFLAEQGLEVHAIDRRGSGLNFQDRGDVQNARMWVNDFDDYVGCLEQEIPTVLLGISWGGKLAAYLASRNGSTQSGSRSRSSVPALAGVGLICPGIYAFQQIRWFKRCFVQLSSRVGLKRRRVQIPLSNPKLFTDNRKYQDYIRDDPFTLRKITMRFAAADLALNEMARSCAESIQLPMFLLLAGRERIVDNAKTRNYWNRIGSDRKQLIEYPHSAHTLEFEEDPSPYLAELLSQTSALFMR